MSARIALAQAGQHALPVAVGDTTSCLPWANSLKASAIVAWRDIRARASVRFAKAKGKCPVLARKASCWRRQSLYTLESSYIVPALTGFSRFDNFGICRELPMHRIPDTFVSPVLKLLVDAIPAPILRRKESPLSTAAHDSQHRLDKTPIFVGVSYLHIRMSAKNPLI